MQKCESVKRVCKEKIKEAGRSRMQSTYIPRDGPTAQLTAHCSLAIDTTWKRGRSLNTTS